MREVEQWYEKACYVQDKDAQIFEIPLEEMAECSGKQLRRWLDANVPMIEASMTEIGDADKDRVVKRVEALYSKRRLVLPQDKKIFRIPLAKMAQRKKRSLERWLEKNTPLIEQSIEAAA